ncbi:MAG: response regulator transcription factor [Actinomycetota bacterium]
MGGLAHAEPLTRVRVLVVDDDSLVREGAADVLASLPGMEVVGQAANPMELAASMEVTRPNVVVLDIRMPPTYQMEGIEAARRLRREHQAVGVVILSQHADPEYVLELLRDGSAGRAYLLKERLGNPAQLAEAIRAVASGGSLLDPKVVDGLLETQGRRANSRLQNLDAQELALLSLMVSGRSNEAIANDLHLSGDQVEGGTHSVFSKLQLSESQEPAERVPTLLFFLQRALD